MAALDYTPLGAPENPRSKIAMAMIQNGMDTAPIRSWTQGAARVANALAGQFMLNRQDADNKAAIEGMLGAVMGGQQTADAGTSPAAAPMGNNAAAAASGTMAGKPYGSNTVPTDSGDTIALPPSNPLGKLDPNFRTQFADLRSAAADRGVDFNAPEAGSIGNVRTPDQQGALYAQGRTAPGPVVTGTLNSNHLTGNALDVVPQGGATDRQVGQTVTDLIANNPQFAGMRSGATFKNLYDPLHVENMQGQRTQVASTDPSVGMGSVAPQNAPILSPSITNAAQPPQQGAGQDVPPPQQTAQNAPPQMNGILAAPQRAQPSIPPNIAAAVRAAMSSDSPQAQAFAAQILQKYIQPTNYGFQTLPDGTVIRTNPQTGSADPIYQGQKPYGFQTMPDGTMVRTNPVSGTAEPIYQGQKPYGFQTLPDGTMVRTNPISGTAEPIYKGEVKPVSVSPGASLVNPNTGQKVYGNDQSMLPPETIDQMARQAIAGDTSVFMNLGRGAQASENIVAVRKRMAEINSGTGETGAEQANRNAEFFGAKQGQRTLGTKQANIEMAATEFNQVLPVVQKASLAVDRTKYSDLNKIVQAFNEHTGDPNIVAFGGAVNTLVNIYARAISPAGVGTVSDKEHAREILNKAWSQGQFDAAVGMMQQEINAALNSPLKVRDDMRKRFIEGQGGSSNAAAPASTGSSPKPGNYKYDPASGQLVPQ